MTTTTTHRRVTRLVGAAIVLAMLATGCGGVGTPVAADPDPVDDEAGFGAPAAAPGEFDPLAGVSMVGTLELAPDGCWYLSGNGESALFVAPTGTRLGDDGTSLVTGEGLLLTDGSGLEAVGGIVEVAELPGGADGRWGSYVAFCDPDARVVAVAATVALAFDPAAADSGALAGELDAALFDTDRGCGYGFATGDADGRWALHIAPTTPVPPTAGPVTLPDERFVVTVTAGAHLFSNHCDDVVEWFEPMPTPAVTWEVTSGSFTYPEASLDMCVGDPPVTTTLVGASVDTPSGPVALEALEITNRSFGCFAG